MFSQVQNIGGQAGCQDQRTTFEVMRRSQALTWPPPLQISYLADLQAARRDGTNLMSVKYAHMMASTHPGEYAALAGQLPQVEEDSRALVEEICAVHRAWDEAMIARYPHLRGRGRPAATSQDSALVTSAETYLRGELLSYSAQSIALYHAWVVQAEEAGINLAEETLRLEVQAYGYQDLEDAEAHLAQR